MRTISDIPISKNDYREMVNASFKGGLSDKVKTYWYWHQSKKKQI